MTDETPQGEVPAEAAIPAPEQAAEPAAAPEVPERTPDDASEEKPRGGFQRRIAELTRNWREEQRRNEELMTMLSQQVRPPEAPKEEPTLEQFNFDEGAYRKALVEYTRAEARRETQETLRRERDEATARDKVTSFQSREAEFAETVDDYYDVVYSPTTPISKTMADVIAESEEGAKLAYHLAKNPKVARAIYNLPPLAAARELGRIEAKLTAPPPPKPSAAPPPPPKIEAVEPQVEKDPDKMSLDEWMKWRHKNLKKSSPPWAR